MSFGESIFSSGFIQKIVKADLHVRINRAYSSRNEHQKVPEDTTPKQEPRGCSWGQPTQPAGRPAPRATRQPPLYYVGSPPPPRLYLHRSLSQFDPRAHDGRFCNTLGVCHQLSNGFELKHDMSSGNEGVKIKST